MNYANMSRCIFLFKLNTKRRFVMENIFKVFDSNFNLVRLSIFTYLASMIDVNQEKGEKRKTVSV